ncbi:MAG: hypothetical protein IJU16_03790, partial [Clostridia bacterium]|nr:hypothetical protein [Clostridia bacterium]
MAHCCFDKISIQGIFHPLWPYGTDLYDRLLYIETEQTQVLLCALDSGGTFYHEADRFREEVSANTGIPANNIWYHELQIHAGPDGQQLRFDAMDQLIRLVSDKVNDMKTRAVPFTCDVAEADVGTKYTMNREQYVEGLGGVTIWTGMSFDEQRRPYSQNPNIMLLRGYQPKLPVFDEPIYFDNPVDQKAYLFVFRDEAGKVIGTVSRFAAHPDVSVLFELRKAGVQHYYDFDWPGYLSEKLEREFEAPSMYLNGPCADLSTKKGYDGFDDYFSSAKESKRIGEELADVLMARYVEKRVPLGHADNCVADTFTFYIPMRESMPYSFADLDKIPQATEEAERALQQAIADDAPAYVVKRLIDERYRTPCTRALVQDVCDFDEETLKRHTAKVTVAVMKLGDYLFFGVPGESLVDMGLWLRTTFTGVKTIPLDQVNGYYSYMATPRSLTLGGYT